MWQVFVFFLCPTQALAVDAAVMLDTDPNLLPHQCRWVKGERQANVLARDIIVLPSGREAVIGQAELLKGDRGWSAGVLPPIS